MGTPYQVKKEKPIQSRQGLRSAFASRPAKSSKGKKSKASSTRIDYTIADLYENAQIWENI